VTEELLREQVLLLRQQNKTLLNIATHTRLLFVLNWIALVAGVLVVTIMAGSDSDEAGPALVCLVVGGLMIFAIARGIRNVDIVEPSPNGAPQAD
jgi:hypothetical protein